MRTSNQPPTAPGPRPPSVAPEPKRAGSPGPGPGPGGEKTPANFGTLGPGPEGAGSLWLRSQGLRALPRWGPGDFRSGASGSVFGGLPRPAERASNLDGFAINLLVR